MNPPKGTGYGGIEIPSDPAPPSDSGEILLRQAARELRRAKEALEAATKEQREFSRGMESRMGQVEGRCTGMETKLTKQGEEVSETLLAVKSVKAIFNHLSGKAILGAIAIIAGSVGINKVTTEKTPAPQIIYQKSALDRMVDVCKTQPDYPPNNLGVTPQMECAIRLARESFGGPSH
jgi:hypothetical protein